MNRPKGTPTPGQGGERSDYQDIQAGEQLDIIERELTDVSSLVGRSWSGLRGLKIHERLQR
jgi:hypothetical protein